MNCYEVKFSGPTLSQRVVFPIIAETLESAISPARAALADSYGSEVAESWQLTSINEIAQHVVIPESPKRPAKKRR